MNPERWHEIERLYRAARERKAEEREAFLNEACAGKESLQKEVESLLSYRPKAEKFMEPPALEAAKKIFSENQPSESTAGSAQRMNELTEQTGPRPGRQAKLPPWWIFFLCVPFVTSAGFLYFCLFFGPESAGWMLQRDNRPSAEGWNQIMTIRPQSPAARAGFQSGDLVLSNDLDQFRTHRNADQLRFQVKRHSESMELTLTLKRKSRDYWLSAEGVRIL
jgi:hypothetical protein